jgi:hypothetical protein
LLLELALLTRIARKLRLDLLLLLLLLLSKALRLARIASELLLHGSSPKTCWLRTKATLEAAGLLERLLLLAILRLPRPGTIAAP